MFDDDDDDVVLNVEASCVPNWTLCAMITG